MKNEKITHIYTANENDRNWTMPTELEIKAAYKRYKKFKESGVIELDMCCFCKTDLIELLSYQKGSIDEIDGYAETLFYVDDSRFLKILEECDALSGEIFNFNDAYNWVVKYYDATMSKNMFEECIQNTIKTDDNNAFFERRVEKWKKTRIVTLYYHKRLEMESIQIYYHFYIYLLTNTFLLILKANVSPLALGQSHFQKNTLIIKKLNMN